MTLTPEEAGKQLRKSAEEKLRQTESLPQEQLTPDGTQALLHDLRVHQIELEMQNDELRRTQHQLEISQARYFDLYNLAPVGYTTLSEEGIIEEANLTCANLLGVARGELVKRPFSHFVFAEDQDIYYLHCRKLMEMNAAHKCEVRMVRADGSLFWALLQGVPGEEKDAGAGYRLVLHDCTNRKIAELEVETIKNQWEKTFNAIDEVITIHDRDMHIVRANKAAGKLLGMEPTELAGKYCYQVFRKAERPCPGCPEVLARMTNTPYRSNIHHEKLAKTFTVAAYPLVESQGEGDYVCIAKDITESLQMEMRLRQMHKLEAIGVLAGGIAHDFNNILFPILGYAELAELRLPPEDTVTASYLQKIVQGALRAKEMTAQILAFSCQVPVQKYPFHPHLVVQEALSLLRVSLPSHIELVADISSECGSILADPTQYYQIVMNLCTNAFHAMEVKGGVLRVSLQEVTIGKDDRRVLEDGFFPDDYIDLEVSDTGIGMEPGVVGKIFDIYFTTKSVGKGSGMGLSVAHGIVKSCQGQITVHSELGKGTSFHVFIPRVAEKSAEVEKALPLPTPSGAERIVAVDDEKMITSLFQAIFKRFGYEGIVFNSSTEALEYISQTPDALDMLITDMTMPQMNGLDLSRKVLALRPDLPIILCTGYSELVNEEKAREAGIQTFLMKPFALDDLLSAMRKMFEKKKGEG
ncbi:MAG: PAS domain [Desulfobulbaceae bacterium]|nr:MAG: PAS domain [Desulfobulbaceae bacterium]